MGNIKFIFDYNDKGSDKIKNSINFLIDNKEKIGIDKLDLSIFDNPFHNPNYDAMSSLTNPEYLKEYDEYWWNVKALEKCRHLVDEIDIQHVILFEEPTDIFNNVKIFKDEINENFAVNHPNVKICYIQNKEKIYSGEYTLLADEKDWLYQM
jgi:hypothetical protein